MLIEMHSHTSEHSACSAVAAVDLVRQVYACGLQGVVITDHHYLWSDDELAGLRRRAELPGYFLLLSGQEVSTRELGDVLVYGAGRAYPGGTSLAEIRREFPGAALVWAHPYRNGRRPSAEKLQGSLINGVEIFNSNHTVRENRYGLEDWHRLRFTALAGTDTHDVGYAATYPTHFYHPVAALEELAAEITAGRCRPFFREITCDGANTKVTAVSFGVGEENMPQPHRYIIKATETDEKWGAAERAFLVMTGIRESGFDTPLFRVPEPLDRDLDERTVVEEAVMGTPLYDVMLKADDDWGKECLRFSACWLARLHAMRLHITPPEEFLPREEERLLKYLHYFSSAGHPHTLKAEMILEEILCAERETVQGNPAALVQGHGDFHPKNIFIGPSSSEGPTVAAIDYDSSCCQPAAFDVGYFLAQFRHQFFDREDIRRRFPDSIFLDAYVQAAGGVTKDFGRDIGLFRARTNLNIASFLVWLGRGDDEGVWRLLVEAEQLLSYRWSSPAISSS